MSQAHTRTPVTLSTERLILRQWQPEDRAPFAALNADPEVMEFFPAPLTREESDRLAGGFAQHIETHGYGRWVVEERTSSAFLGFVGLSSPAYTTHFTPCTEIAWRLGRAAWGQGFASEAAREALRFGFRELGLPEIVSFTAVENERSQRVMQRLGMQRDLAGDFEHPSLAPGHPLRPHVLYRMSQAQFAATWE